MQRIGQLFIGKPGRGSDIDWRETEGHKVRIKTLERYRRVKGDAQRATARSLTHKRQILHNKDKPTKSDPHTAGRKSKTHKGVMYIRQRNGKIATMDFSVQSPAKVYSNRFLPDTPYQLDTSIITLIPEGFLDEHLPLKSLTTTTLAQDIRCALEYTLTGPAKCNRSLIE